MPDTTEITPADVHRLLQEFMSRERQTYIGMRYVPVFADPIEWSAETEYEPLTYVKYAGYLYISKGYVPAGITPLDSTFWILVSFGESGGGTSDSHTYDTVAQLLSDTSLAAGDVCRTLGYYEPLDDGGSTYVISASDVPDGVARLEMSNGLTAVLVYEGSMCPVQFGAHPLDPATSPDTITDDMLSDEAFFYMLSADIAIDGRNRGYGIRYLVTTGNIADVRNCSLFVLAPVNITGNQLVNIDNVNVDSGYITGTATVYAVTLTGDIARVSSSTFKGSNRFASGVFLYVNRCGCLTGCKFTEYNYAINSNQYKAATIVIQNCSIYNNTIGIYARTTRTYINECVFTDNRNYGITANVSDAFVHVTSCYFNSCGNAIQNTDALGTAIIYTYVVGNLIERCSNRNSFAIVATRTLAGSIIANNTIKDCAGSGIRTDASIVAGNYIYNVGTQHPAYTYDYGEAIRLDSMTGNPIEVHGNVISGCWKYGILYVQSDTALANQPKLFIHGNTINGVVNDGDDAYSIYLVNSHSGAGMSKPAVLRDNVSDFPMYNYGQEIDTDCSVPIADATLSPDVVVPSMCDGSLTDMISAIYDAANTPELEDGSVYITADSAQQAYVKLAHYLNGESVAIRLGINTSYNNFTLQYYRSWDDYNDDNPAVLNLTDAATIGFRPQYIVLPPCYGPIQVVIPAAQSCEIFELAIMKKFTAWDGAFPPNTHMTNDYTQGT